MNLKRTIFRILCFLRRYEIIFGSIWNFYVNFFLNVKYRF